MQRSPFRFAPFLLLVALVLCLGPAIDASPVADATVLGRVPSLGDAALYDVEARVAGQVIRGMMLAEWQSEDVQVPGGKAIGLPTLRLTFLDESGRELEPAKTPNQPSVAFPPGKAGSLNPTKDYTSRAPPFVQQRAAHTLTAPGALVALTTVWYDVDAEDGAERGEWVHRVMTVDACDPLRFETVLVRIVGLAATDAASALRGCGAMSLGDALRVESSDARLALTMRPGLSLPLVVEASLLGPHEEAGFTASIVGWEAGVRPVVPAARPMPALAPLPLVDWTESGVGTGDLVDHPFGAAMAAVARTQDGVAFFGGTEESAVYVATHVWDQPVPGTAGEDAWEGRIKGLRCAPEPAFRPAGVADEWSISWIAPGASIFSITQRIAPLGSASSLAAAERVVATSLDTYGTAEGGEPARRGPAPAALAARLSDLDSVRPRGVASIDYQFADPGGAPVSMAAVSRGTCTRDLEGRLGYEGTSIWFVDGEPTTLTTASIERQTSPVAALPPVLSSGSAVPSKPEAPSLAPFSFATFAAGGAAAAALVAPKAFEALYTRLDRANALKNPKRAALMAAVRADPGVPLLHLVGRLGQPRTSLDHHARVLRRLGFVKAVRTAEGVALYPVDHEAALFAEVLTRAHAREILGLVRRCPGLTQKAIAARLGIGKGQVSSLLHDLEAAGLLTRTRSGKELLVHGTPAAGRLDAQ